jgi:hypothetical protein
MIMLSGMAVAMIATLVLIFNFLFINFVQRDLSDVRTQTEQASNDLMINAYNAMQSDTIRHMVRVQELLDQLAAVDGTLVKYDVQGKKVEWQALIPPAFAQDYGTPQGLAPDGRARVKNTK